MVSCSISNLSLQFVQNLWGCKNSSYFVVTSQKQAFELYDRGSKNCWKTIMLHLFQSRRQRSTLCEQENEFFITHSNHTYSLKSIRSDAFDFSFSLWFERDQNVWSWLIARCWFMFVQKKEFFITKVYLFYAPTNPDLSQSSGQRGL